MIELKELSSADERQVYTRLICISLESCRHESGLNHGSKCSVLPNCVLTSDDSLELKKCTTDQSYIYPQKHVKKLRKLLVTQYNDERLENDQRIVLPSSKASPSRERAKISISVPDASLGSPFLDLRLCKSISCYECENISEVMGSDKTHSSLTSPKVSRPNCLANMSIFQKKTNYSLKRYIVIFLALITLLMLTLVVLCSQVTLPGHGSHLTKEQPSHTTIGLKKLPNGNLVHYVGSKFMAPATRLQIREHLLHLNEIKLKED